MTAFRDARLLRAKKYVERADVSQLPPRQREALEAVMFTELPMREIGMRLGISRQAVRWRVEAALVSLGIWKPLGVEAGPQTKAKSGGKERADAEAERAKD